MEFILTVWNFFWTHDEAIFPLIGVIWIFVIGLIHFRSRLFTVKKPASSPPTPAPAEPVSDPESPLAPVELKPVLNSTLSLWPTIKLESPIELSLKELMGKFESLTTVEAKPIAKGYLGKAMLVVAEVADVTPRGEDTSVFLSLEDSEGRMSIVTTSFGPDWKDRVRRLHRGDSIKVYGIISDLPKLSLEHCKLMTEKLVPDYE